MLKLSHTPSRGGHCSNVVNNMPQKEVCYIG